MGDAEEAHKLAEDAYFFCCRAKHDAIDAATAKMAIDLRVSVKGVGAAEKAAIFPRYREFLRELTAVQNKIVASREDRENRDVIYSLIQSTDFDKLVGWYQEFLECEPELIEVGKANRRKPLINGASGLGFVVLGFLLSRFFG